MSPEKKSKKSEKSDRKHKKSKKEKKEKKSNSKKDKKKKKHSNRDGKDKETKNLIDPNISASISHLLAGCLAQHSQSFNDLPAMMSSLDRNDAVNIDAISDLAYRSTLSSIFAILPLELHAGRGWLKKISTPSVSGFILMAMLEAGAIRQPNALTSAQATSQRAMTKILSGSCNFLTLY